MCKKILSAFFVLKIFVVSAVLAEDAMQNKEKNTMFLSQDRVEVYRDGNDFMVRSGWSEKFDLVICCCHITVDVDGGSGMPNEQSFLIPVGTPLREFAKRIFSNENHWEPWTHTWPGAILLHRSTDEFPAYPCGDYGILGGNHGSVFGRKFTAPGHGLGIKDLGCEFSSAAGDQYYLIAILDNSNFILHPAGKKTGFPDFPKFTDGEKLFREGRAFPYEKCVGHQVLPSNRIIDEQFLVNGTEELPDRTPIVCQSFLHVFNYQIILPEERVKLFRERPGVAHDFCAPELPGLLEVRLTHSYQPCGACVISITDKVLRDFSAYSCFGVMMGWGTNPAVNGVIASGGYCEFYIPKLKKIKASCPTPGKNIEFDFSAVAQYPEDLENRVNHVIKPSDCIDPADPPDRFIRLSGEKSRDYGSVVGYSLINGVTAKENHGSGRPELYLLYYTRKAYPYAYWADHPKAGEVRHVTAYRQYFNPAVDPDATAFYYHREGNSWLVYFDCHKPLKKHRLKLPEFMTGKRIQIVEKTPSVIMLNSEEHIKKNGILIDVTDKSGYIVLKLED